MLWVMSPCMMRWLCKKERKSMLDEEGEWMGCGVGGMDDTECWERVMGKD